MKKIQDTPMHEIFIDYYNGQQVKIFRNKATGELKFNKDDVARVLGFKNDQEMLKNPLLNAMLRRSNLNTSKKPLGNPQGFNHNLI